MPENVMISLKVFCISTVLDKQKACHNKKGFIFSGLLSGRVFKVYKKYHWEGKSLIYATSASIIPARWNAGQQHPFDTGN
jgi:hypothetical protein